MQNKYLLIYFASAFLLCLILYMTQSIMLPFLLSITFSYILNPIVNRISNTLQIKRSYSSLIAILLFFFTMLILLLTIVPMLYKQFIAIGGYIAAYRHLTIDDYTSFIFQYIPIEFIEQFKSSIQDIIGQIVSISGFITKQLIQSSMTFFNIISYIMLTPFLTFFLLKDVQIFKNFIYALVPIRLHEECQILGKDINQAISSYLCGQFYVACSLCIYYIICFYCAKLNSAVALGIISGFFVFIPYVGAAISFLLTLSIAMLQFHNFSYLLVITAIFIIGQIIEGFFLTPKLIGTKTGLHPLLIIFFLLLGGNLFGFIGVLLAIPSSAVLLAIIKYAMKKYHNSKFYNLQ